MAPPPTTLTRPSGPTARPSCWLRGATCSQRGTRQRKSRSGTTSELQQTHSRAARRSRRYGRLPEVCSEPARVPHEEQEPREVPGADRAAGRHAHGSRSEPGVDPDRRTERPGTPARFERDARVDEHDVSGSPETVAPADEIMVWDAVDARAETDRQPLLRQQAIDCAEASRVDIGHRYSHSGVPLARRRPRHVGLITRAHKIGTREVRQHSGGHPSKCLTLQDQAPAAVAKLDGLIDRKLERAPALKKVGRPVLVVARGYFDSHAEGDVGSRVRTGIE